MLIVVSTTEVVTRLVEEFEEDEVRLDHFPLIGMILYYFSLDDTLDRFDVAATPMVRGTDC